MSSNGDSRVGSAGNKCIGMVGSLSQQVEFSVVALEDTLAKATTVTISHVGPLNSS